MANNSVKPICFYLPQFHPTLENDEWWGKGFTEWTNVTKTKPLFSGHYQPHLPTDLGFYDLRLPEARMNQVTLAKDYGIHGFCYYHYWFNGRRILERPFNEVLASGEPDFPFCLCWANESWSRRWLGEDREILLEQTYSQEDDVRHAEWLLQVFADPRCLRIHGRPVFLVYRPKHLPDPQRTTDIIRNTNVKAGLAEPYIIGVDAHCPNFDCRTLGFDATLKFEPQLGVLPAAFSDKFSVSRLRKNLRQGVLSGKLKLYNYEEARALMNANTPDHPFYPSVFVSWDNTPRRGDKGIIVVDSTPEKFGKALSGVIDSVKNRPNDEQLVFINAWNEWAEGNYLEPDNQHGLAFLNEIKKNLA